MVFTDFQAEIISDRFQFIGSLPSVKCPSIVNIIMLSLLIMM